MPVYEVCLLKFDGRGVIDVVSIMAVNDAQAKELGLRFAESYPTVEVWRRSERILQTRRRNEGFDRSQSGP